MAFPATAQHQPVYQSHQGNAIKLAGALGAPGDQASPGQAIGKVATVARNALIMGSVVSAATGAAGGAIGGKGSRGWAALGAGVGVEAGFWLGALTQSPIGLAIGMMGGGAGGGAIGAKKHRVAGAIGGGVGGLVGFITIYLVTLQMAKSALVEAAQGG